MIDKEKYQLHKKDTGSTAIQIIALREEIQKIVAHWQRNRKINRDVKRKKERWKDVPARRALLEKLAKEKSLIIVFSLKKTGKESKSQKPNSENPRKKPEIPPPQNPPLPEENSECPYLKETDLTTFRNDKEKYNKMTLLEDEELPKWRKIPTSYITNLWKKGYHWHDIIQLWEWKIPEPEIPDLKTERRVGVINELSVTHNYDLLDKDIPKEEKGKMDKYVGLTKNMVIIVRKIPGGGSIINIDRGQLRAPMIREGKEVYHYTKKIINLFLKQEKLNPANYQISVLDSLGVENFGQESKVAFGKSGGKSAGSAVYLALLSAYHQIPISRSVTATGSLSLSTKITKKGKVNEQQFTIPVGTVLPVLELKQKTQAATEKGINRFVFSKYQSPSNLLSKWQRRKWKGSWDSNNNKNYTKEKWILAENYQEVVPTETKSKIKEIHWTENIQELKDLILQKKLE